MVDTNVNQANQRRRRCWILVGAGIVGLAALILTIILVAVLCSSEDPKAERYKLTTFDAMGNKKVMDMTPDQFFEAMKANTAFMLGEGRTQSEALYSCILDMTKDLDKWKVAADEAAATAEAEKAATDSTTGAEKTPSKTAKLTAGDVAEPVKTVFTAKVPETKPAKAPTPEPSTTPEDTSGLRGTASGVPVSLPPQRDMQIAERLEEKADETVPPAKTGVAGSVWNYISAVPKAIGNMVPPQLFIDTYEGDLGIDDIS
ncbi:Crooked neck cell cycle isoform 1, putative [Babesia ovata]|uniref:Crooked neck cell cycle isoform 1, putative n=1 Tax=Babesia ovata TaxID=189622 RepID=A0A2H6K980_9APIC|nr:Crooked neck cell cycle isoform 1, putative [Babesia ovata]GBE59541.1 Crooked neck cell cycle isoform 1, putative [Babesia ovata]